MFFLGFDLQLWSLLKEFTALLKIGGFQLQDINTEGTGPKVTMQFLVLHLLFQGVLLENISTETAMS